MAGVGILLMIILHRSYSAVQVTDTTLKLLVLILLCLPQINVVSTKDLNNIRFLLNYKPHVTSIKELVWGEWIFSERAKERSDGPKSSLTGCTNTSGGAPPCNSLPRQTIAQNLEQHRVDKRERKRVWLGGLGELTVTRLLSIHPTHSWNYGTRAAVAVCSPGAPASTTPLYSHCLPATS